MSFLHLEQGTNLSSPISDEDPNLYVNAGTGACSRFSLHHFSH
jgi:hypothetical protein